MDFYENKEYSEKKLKELTTSIKNYPHIKSEKEILINKIKKDASTSSYNLKIVKNYN